MRLAKTGDTWRNLYKRNFKNRITSLEFDGITGIGKGKVSFSGGITVICGANGVGKTTLLNALLLSIKSIVSPVPHNIKSRFNSSVLLVSAIENGEERTYLKSSSDEEVGLSVEIGYIDSSHKSSRLIDFFSEMTNREELFEGIDPIHYSEEEIKLISYVTGKNYSSCDVYEIDAFDPEAISGFDDVIPYFKVVDSNTEYGLEMMGLGELAAHLLIWSIKRAPQDSIFFLEEPESFISPKAQVNLMNYIASVSLDKGIWLVITTHSMGIVSNIPLNHIKILSKNHDGIDIIETPNQFQLNMILGISFSYSGILFVEDMASKVFTRAILEHFDGDISRRIDIVKAGSSSAISNVLYNFPKPSKEWLKIIGVYDGDIWPQKKSVIDDKKVKWEYLFLPGPVAPEILLRDFFRNNTYGLENKLAVTESNLKFALNSLDGCNHHDWPTDLARFLEVNEEDMLRDMFRLWLEAPQNETQARATFDDISAKFSKQQ
ncbi:AAA family ATPase [Hymenobacter monticola]|uniref:AAA family ATPase n=1 Tax=Hymenobacter monticola TaxID=1705399 RepID=A0ABY4BHM7_9BACT|nr:AAA family ATPase [Hymenobacter monticola]UOE36130.1 AAA family ATPase [Hymenobacter monticola]